MIELCMVKALQGDGMGIMEAVQGDGMGYDIGFAG